ncbi:MAG TPA: hypothetical protein DCQ06_01405 [Myxococcales bacterium]|nr:hypothetical protein [Myxococcales bacterium]
MTEKSPTCREIIDTVECVFRGKREIVQYVLAAVLARGHALLEDVPGVGKTTLARTFAHVLGLAHQRIQFASDLMPADITGIGIYDQGKAEFVFKQGPVFCNVLLADEINRTTPRTQSALLEAMAEGHVTVDGVTHQLPSPFVVLATQNPREFHGTYPLPESQLDRFLVRLSVGYPEQDVELELLKRHGAPMDLSELPVLCDQASLEAMMAKVDQVHVADDVLDYLHRLVIATRDSDRLELGLSPRAAIGWYRVVQAMAFITERDFATPDDVQNSFLPVSIHRAIPAGHKGGAVDTIQAETILRSSLESVPPPM